MLTEELPSLYTPDAPRPLDRQEALNRIYDVFIKHETPRARRGTACFYYSPDHPTGCAVGCLFSRDLAERLQYADGGDLGDSTPIVGLTDTLQELGCLLETNTTQPGSDIKFLRACQRWHDINPDISVLRDIAKEYNLTLPE